MSDTETVYYLVMVLLVVFAYPLFRFVSSIAGDVAGGFGIVGIFALAIGIRVGMKYLRDHA